MMIKNRMRKKRKEEKSKKADFEVKKKEKEILYTCSRGLALQATI